MAEIKNLDYYARIIQKFYVTYVKSNRCCNDYHEDYEDYCMSHYGYYNRPEYNDSWETDYDNHMFSMMNGKYTNDWETYYDSIYN
jgi:hypothetical protein